MCRLIMCFVLTLLCYTYSFYFVLLYDPFWCATHTFNIIRAQCVCNGKRTVLTTVLGNRANTQLGLNVLYKKKIIIINTVYSGENGEKLQRRYSWKISRPSLRRKSKFSNAECESDDQGILVSNNNNSHPAVNSR